MILCINCCKNNVHIGIFISTGYEIKMKQTIKSKKFKILFLIS